AEQTAELNYLGVVGPDRTPSWFAKRAEELGLKFLEPIPQRLHALASKPRYPGCLGGPRRATADDVDLLAEWIAAFTHEATPHDPVPSRERLETLAREGSHVFWVIDGQPVSMAAIVRRTRYAAGIAAVYTPPALRGNGYAGSATAAAVEQVFAEGKTI